MARQINIGGNLIRKFGAFIDTKLNKLTEVNGVATGIIGVVGLAEKGPSLTPVTISSYTELVETFGDGPLVRHGLSMFVGGAQQLVCVRIGNPTRAELVAINVPGGSVADGNADGQAYTFKARDTGTLGNKISVSVENTTSLEGVLTFTIRIKYVDTAGNDIRETFVTPRNVPQISYWGSNTVENRYFVLRNNVTGQLRDIPTSWTFNNVDEQAFRNTVESLKDVNETLISVPSVDVGSNPVSFPLAFIQAMLNVGAFGQGPSALVTMEDVNPSMDDLLIQAFTYNPATADKFVTHPYVSLTGGTNGDDGTNYYGKIAGNDVNYDVTYNLSLNPVVIKDVWGAGFATLESEEVNFIQPAYLFNYKRNIVANASATLSNTYDWLVRLNFFKGLMPSLLAHVNVMSSIPNRLYRTSIVGLPYYLKAKTAGELAPRTAQTFLNEIQDISGLINNDRFQVWAGGFKSSAFSNGVEEYGAETLASFVVGVHASREVSQSITFARLSGIFTDGLEFNWSKSQEDELYARSLNFVMKRRNSANTIEYVAAHNYTSFTGSESRGLQRFVTRRIVDAMNSFVYKNLEEQFIGAKSLGGQTESQIRDFMTVLLNRLIREGTIVAFANLRVFAEPNDKTVYNIEYDFQPVTEINFLPVTNYLTYSLA